MAGMAVAVGLGMAVVSNAGVANAETGENSKDSSSAAAASASGTSASHETSSASQTTSSAQGSSAESTAQTGEDTSNAATAGSSENRGGSASGSASASTADNDVRDGAVQVSGGAVVTSRSSDSGSAGSVNARQNSGGQTSGSTNEQPKTDTTSSALNSSSTKPHETTATTESAAGAQSVEGNARTDGASRRNDAPTAASDVKAARPATGVAVESTVSTAAATASNDVEPVATTASISTTLVRQPVVAAQKPAEQTAAVTAADIVTRAIAVVSSLVGFAPSAQNTPTAPQPTPALWTVLAWARREFEQMFNNHAPQLNYDADDNKTVDGVMSGDLVGVDPDGDPLSYKVVQGPARGTVDVHADGTFTYTPSAALADSGGTDSFVVTVSDQSPALFPGLRNLVESLTGTVGTHTTTQTINVPVAAPTSGVMVVPNHVKRLDIVVPNTTYADLRARFEQAIPTASADLTALLAAGTPNYDALVAATNANAPHGFIRYYSLDASRLTVWGYDPADTHSVQYLFGNPLVTQQLHEQNPSTLLASPLRAQIYEAPDGSVHFVIDDPSSGFDSFGDPEISAIGAQQDQAVAALLTYLNVPVPNELVHSATPAPAPTSRPEDTSFFGRLVQVVQHTFFNNAPSVGYDDTQTSQGRNGVLTGAINGSDADGDAVTYKLSQGPANGSVVVNADGTFTYTPSAALANSGGTDSFVVAVNDGSDPLQDVIGSLLPAGSGHTTTKTINVSVHAPNTGVTVYSENVNRLDIIVDDTYAGLRAKFEAAAPNFSLQVLQILGAGKPNYDGLVAAVAANSATGFIRFTTIETSQLLKVAGVPADATNAVQYLVGNPVFAEQMYREDRSSQMYAPLRATIYQAANGTVHFVIDQPSTRFNTFDNPAIDGVGEFLDDKIANLLAVIGAPVPDVLTEQSV